MDLKNGFNLLRETYRNLDPTAQKELKMFAGSVALIAAGIAVFGHNTTPSRVIAGASTSLVAARVFMMESSELRAMETGDSAVEPTSDNVVPIKKIADAA